MDTVRQAISSSCRRMNIDNAIVVYERLINTPSGTTMNNKNINGAL